MAFSYGFFDSVNGDRKYTALEMSSIFDGVITDGVLPDYLEEFAVVPGNGLSLVVKSGRAWFDHTWNYNSSNLLLYINEADRVLTRYDAVVLEVNKERDVRANTIKLITGNPSTSPTRPQLANTKYVKQYALAYIQIDPKVTTIEAGKIQNMVGTPNTPYATSELTATDISAVFMQWQGEFEEWYETVKHITSGESIVALQAELAKKLPRADKATASTPITDDTKYLTPKSGVALVQNQVYPVGSIIATSGNLPIGGSWINCKNDKFLNTNNFPTLFSKLGHSYGGRSRLSLGPAYNIEKKYVEGINMPIVLRDEDLAYYSPISANVVRSQNKNSRAHDYGEVRFDNAFIVPKPKSSGSQVDFFGHLYLYYRYQGHIEDYSLGGNIDFNDIELTRPIASTGVNGDSYSQWPTFTYLDDTIIPIGTTKYACYVIAVVNAENKYIVKHTNVQNTISVEVYTGSGASVVKDDNRSYTINIAGTYGGCWVFNNQIYYISNNTLYMVTFGSMNPTVFSGSSEQEQIIRARCANLYNYEFSGYKQVLINGYSLDNRIYVEYYNSGEIYNATNLGSLALTICYLKNEYTGEITKKTVNISAYPFAKSTLGSSTTEMLQFIPVIKRRGDSFDICVIVHSETHTFLINSSSWGEAGGGDRRREMFLAVISKKDLENDYSDGKWFYSSRIYAQGYYAYNDGYQTKPMIGFVNQYYRWAKGVIWETLSDIVTVPFIANQYFYNDTYNNPIQVAAPVMDLTTFSMPWLNDVTSSTLFYIRYA